ncbi:MAG: peptidylprolyl isomerase [Bacteroidales bacterium]|nr:peptidylprolyl isomerase [Bacteroidales bacterium]
MKNKIIGIGVAIFCVAMSMAQSNNVIDEVAWVVGDEPIYKSDIEAMYSQMQYDGTVFDGSPYCVIPEQLAVEKLYLHQAKLDTIEAPEAMVQQSVDKRLNFFIANLGSKERVEEHFRKPLPILREQLIEVMRTQYIVQQVQESLTKDVKATPGDVRKYFNNLEEDSIPYIPLQVEAQIITLNPVIPQQEIDDVKSRLRDYTDRVNRGESEFSTLAIMYSEDGSAMQGGELGFHGRADFVPEFSNVAFNLNDPKKVSKIVETEYGYHIIQLIEKRGDQINCRHILLRPKVSQKDLEDAVVRLDSLRKEIIRDKFTFEDAARYVSQDKDTRYNKGFMVNVVNGSTRFEMQDLPQEVSRKIETMKIGDISEPFVMIDQARNKEVVAIVKLSNRIEGHRATLSDDYNLIKEMYENYQKENIISEWIEKKIKDTYVRIEDGWNDCEFKYGGWMK